MRCTFHSDKGCTFHSATRCTFAPIYSDKEQNKSISIFTQDDSTNIYSQSVENTVADNVTNMEWTKAHAVDERLKMEFQKLCETARLPERERQIVVRLFNGNNFETMEGGK